MDTSATGLTNIRRGLVKKDILPIFNRQTGQRAKPAQPLCVWTAIVEHCPQDGL